MIREGREDHLEHFLFLNPGAISIKRWIGKQLGAGSMRLDLLGEDPVGSWVIVEAKTGLVDRAGLQLLRYENLLRQVQNYLYPQSVQPAIRKVLVSTRVIDDHTLNGFCVAGIEPFRAKQDGDKYLISKVEHRPASPRIDVLARRIKLAIDTGAPYVWRWDEFQSWAVQNGYTDDAAYELFRKIGLLHDETEEQSAYGFPQVSIRDT